MNDPAAQAAAAQAAATTAAPPAAPPAGAPATVATAVNKAHAELKELKWDCVFKYVLMLLVVLLILYLLTHGVEGFQFRGLKAGNAALTLPSRKEGAEFGVRDPSFTFPKRHL